MIEAAFAGVTLGDGVGLQEAQGLDDRETAATLAAYRASDEKEDWRRIPAEKLSRCWTSPSFFDAKGMRFHIPAFIVAALRGLYRQDFEIPLTNGLAHQEGTFALLNAAQQNAVRAYLLFLAEDDDNSYMRADLLRSVEACWSQSEVNGISHLLMLSLRSFLLADLTVRRQTQRGRSGEEACRGPRRRAGCGLS